ncbi:MAG: ribonuclease Z [Pseudomonadota bacterium]
MRHHVHPRLTNPPFSDPGLYVDVGRRRGALLFDIGESGGLSGADLARVSHLFISHTHMDHVVGFDRLVREILGKPVTLQVYGPEGIIFHVGSRMSAYTWNLVEGRAQSPVVIVTEVRPGHLLQQRFECRSGFLPVLAPEQKSPAAVIMDDGCWRVSTEILDHRTPCLGFRLAARDHLNVDTEALRREGFAIGPWLSELKSLAATAPIPETARVTATTRSGQQRSVPAAALARALVTRKRGKTYAYITDASYSPENIRKIVRLAQGADHLFIEAPFLAVHETHATAKCHLTAWQAGTLAAMAGAADFTIFHFSPRYRGLEAQLEAESRRAFLETAPNNGLAFSRKTQKTSQ